jgi:hypothetical protein
MILEASRGRGPRARPVIALAAGLLLAACGHRLPPPGGPEDETPPRITTRIPAPGSVGVDRNITIRIGFDEDMKFQRRPGAVRLVPAHEPLRVRYGWDSVEIRPEGGLAPDCTICVRFERTPTDLRDNPLEETPDFCFGTGDSLHTARLSGTVGVPGSLTGEVVLEAVHLPDSLRYRATVDAEGAWTLDHLPRGRWRVRAFVDTRRDGLYDPPEDVGTEIGRVLTGDSLRVDLQIPDPGPGGP